MSASALDKFKKGASLFSTTLSGSIGSTDLTIPLNSTSGLATGTGVTLTIDGVNSSGVATPSLREVVTGVVSGNNIVLNSTAQRGKEGSAQSHSSGAVVTEYFTKTHWNDLIDGLTADHSQLDGSHHITTNYDVNGNKSQEWAATSSAVNNFKTTNAASGNNPTIQASGGANRALNLLDSNGNEIIKESATASAINEFTVANAATGTGPTLSATGDETDVPINITPKGAGALNENQKGSLIKEFSEDGSTLVARSAIRQELLPNDFVVSGGVWSQASGLNGNMTALVSYTNGKRNTTGAVTNHGFTASKDTYVDVNDAGTLAYTESANAAAAPALSANNQRIALVITDGSGITSVVQYGADTLGNTIYRLSGERGDWWERLGRVRLQAAGTSLSLTSLPARQHLHIIVRGVVSGSVSPIIRFNNDSSGNYAHRQSVNGAADTNTGSASSIPINTAGATYSFLTTLDVANYLAVEKDILHYGTNSTAGAANVPNRFSGVAKWANTSAQITRVDVTSGNNMGVGSELIVLGHN